MRAKGHRNGRLALRRDLRSRGLDEATVEAALEPLNDAQQADAAHAVLSKQAWRFASGDRRKDRAKAAAFLARRGFAGDAVRDALDGAFGGAFEGAEDVADGTDGPSGGA